MPIPVSSPNAAEAYNELRLIGRQARDTAAQVTQVAGGEVNPEFLLQVAEGMRWTFGRMNELRHVGGLKQYALLASGIPDMDLDADLPVAVAAMEQLAFAIAAEFPRDPASGAMAHKSLLPDGTVRALNFPAADFPRTFAAADAVVAAFA